MPTNSKPVVIQIDADPRFAAGAGGAVHFLAENAGLEHEAATQLQTATVNACLEAFALLLAAPLRLEIQLTLYEDRIEIAISHESGGTGERSADSGRRTPAKAIAGVDRVQYEQLGKSSVTRLTKYLVRRS